MDIYFCTWLCQLCIRNKHTIFLNHAKFQRCCLSSVQENANTKVFAEARMMMMSWCLMSSDVIWHIRDKLWPMPKHGSIKSTYVRCMRVLAVTYHLHFWQNDRDFLRATVVTRGWNGYRNKSQHRKSTLEKKILPPFQQGFEPATFQSRVRCSNHWAIPAPSEARSTSSPLNVCQNHTKNIICVILLSH